jgi:hypothetical protein
VAVVVGLLVVIGVIGAVFGKNNDNSNSTTPNSAAAVPVANGPATPKGFTAFRSTADRFIIDVPAAWKAVNPDSPGAQAAMNAMQQSNPNLRSAFGKSAIQLAQSGIVLLAINPVPGPDGFAANINVAANADLTYSDSELPQIAAALPAEYAKLGATITGTSYVTFDGQHALRSTDTLSIKSPLGTDINVQQAQYFLGANGLLYVVTLSGSDPNLTKSASTFSTN